MQSSWSYKIKEKNKDGFYEIILMIDGKPQIVIVDILFQLDYQDLISQNVVLPSHMKMKFGLYY